MHEHLPCQPLTVISAPLQVVKKQDDSLSPDPLSKSKFNKCRRNRPKTRRSPLPAAEDGRRGPFDCPLGRWSARLRRKEARRYPWSEDSFRRVASRPRSAEAEGRGDGRGVLVFLFPRRRGPGQGEGRKKGSSWLQPLQVTVG